MESAMVPLSPDKKSWVTITVAGATAGVIVAALTFSAACTASNAVASTTGFTVDIVGEAASIGTSYFIGPAAGYSVKLATKVAAHATKETMTYSGIVAAGTLSTVVGTVTALTITAGTRLVEYSIEYGGKMSKEVALRVSEAYLHYKTSQSAFIETGDLGESVEDDWILLKDLVPEVEIADPEQSIVNSMKTLLETVKMNV